MPQGLCDDCSAPLLARYDLSRINVGRDDIAHRPPDLWRYHELLPVSAAGHVVSLGEGITPGLRGLHTQLERGLRMLVAMPANAPAVTRAEVLASGAELRLVDGVISDAGRLVARLVAEDPSLTDVATLKEPYRIENKKTIGFELAEQLGWRMPDVIICPTGGGVGLIGIHKALTEMVELGWLTGQMPRFVRVQSTGCAPIVRAFEAGEPESEPWTNANTVAYGITVPKALGDFIVLDILHQTGGIAIAVDDADLLADLRLAGALEGLFFCPEGAATVTAARLLRKEWLARRPVVSERDHRRGPSLEQARFRELVAGRGGASRSPRTIMWPCAASIRTGRRSRPGFVLSPTLSGLNAFTRRLGAYPGVAVAEPTSMTCAAPVRGVDDGGAKLTPWEHRVLARLATGAKDECAARDLGVSPHAYRRHVSELVRRWALQVASRPEPWPGIQLSAVDAATVVDP